MPTDKQLWGGETAKAVENFPISGETVPVEVVRWLARIKGTAAAVNGELGALAAAVGVIESSTARLRLNRVPLFLAGATVLSGLAVVLTLLRSAT